MINWAECKPLSDEALQDTACKALEGDKQAIELLVTSNVKLASSIAHNYKSFDGQNIEDLTSEAILGLVEAIPLFDPDRGTKFTTFASWHMRKRVLASVIDNFRLVKIGTSQAQRKLFWRLNRETQALRKAGIDPTCQAIATRLECKAQDVRDMQVRMGSPESSLDAPSVASEHGNNDLFDVLDSGVESPEHYTTKSRMTAWVQSRMVEFEQRLSDKEMVVWNHRIADNKLTMQDVADKLDCSRQRIQQIEEKLQKAFIKYAQNKARK